MAISPRHKRPYKKRTLYKTSNRVAPAAGKKAERPFEFRIHRRILPVLDRIHVPEAQPFVADPFQVEALATLQQSDVLVTAPTGAGKTYIAVEAIRRIFARGGNSWYASPLKALSNAKYEEFSAAFGAENVGILTGDRKENPLAPIIVGTTEILRNQLYDTMHRGEDLTVDLVVLDEAHYLGDHDRGVVWEEVLIYLPARVKLLLLSATIRNAREICVWLQWLRQTSCRWVSANERPVPLFPLFLFPSGELAPLSSRRGLFAKIRTVHPRSFPRNDFPDIARLMGVLRKANLLPAIFFLKSRADCERAIALCQPVAEAEQRSNAADNFAGRLEQLLDSYPFLRHHQHLTMLKQARVGAHHGGQLPHWKLLLEKLMQDGHLDAIFSTSTVAAGVNFPARTVVIFQSDRFNGKEFVDLNATDLLQMTGRAGRRGMDEIGFVLVVPGPHQDPQLIHDLLGSPPEPIDSQIRINFSMVLNLLLSHSPEEIHALFGASLATYQSLHEERENNRAAQDLQQELEPWLAEMACGSLEALVEVRDRFVKLQEQLQKTRKLVRQQRLLAPLQGLLVPGRVFLNRRQTPFVAIAEPDPEQGMVEAVRLTFPLHFRKNQVRIHRVRLQRIRELGQRLDFVPGLKDIRAWQALLDAISSQPLIPLAPDQKPLPSPAVATLTHEFEELDRQLLSSPCTSCPLHGPCHHSISHPFSTLRQQLLEYHSHLHTIQEELWQSFQHHFHFLQQEGYLDAQGHLTTDGLWASKLRLDQPLLISEGIRQGIFPDGQPEMLAALIAPFVMDRERPNDIQLASLVWKYPDLAKPFFKMLNSLQPLREHLQAEGFSIPPMPFWTLTTVHAWALGDPWEQVREISGMGEGDLAMVILRTADHLRQIQSLQETHPQLAACAHRAIQLLLREPVLVV